MSSPGAMSNHESGPPTVLIRGLSKTFPGQVALANVSMDVVPGEIHALLGHNGSGKSTLIKILAGVYTPDPGASIEIVGEPLPVGSPRDSRRLGLQFVHQALGIVEDLTAVENIALGAGYRQRGHLIDWRGQRAKTRRLLAKLSVEFDIDCPVRDLRPVDRSAIAIARALDDDGGAIRALVLDEPTAALPPSEVEALFGLVRQIRATGTSVLYVSHRLDEIFELADRTTVLRDGVAQSTVSIKDIDRHDLVRMIVGADIEEAAPGGSAGVVQAGEAAALRVEGLTSRRLAGISFAVRKQEILGIAGLTGSGREELAGAMVGQVASAATFTLADGRRYTDPSPRSAKKMGIVLVLPSRTRGSAIREFTVRENLTLPSLPGFARHSLISRASERAATSRWITALDIRPVDPERAFALLSGGNQQKVVFSKWLNVMPTVLVVDDPTSGVDIGARQGIYDLIRARVAEGIACILCSSDAEDLIAICDRVLVLRDGVIADELTGDEIDEPTLLQAMLRDRADQPAGGSAALAPSETS
jgi:ribose transport system ATP-binding protein